MEFNEQFLFNFQLFYRRANVCLAVALAAHPRRLDINFGDQISDACERNLTRRGLAAAQLVQLQT